jgi:hypothetical protein
MANSYDFLGDQRDYFMKSSWQVYTDLNGNRQYVGKTENEKTISPNLEVVEWFDNTDGTQTLFVMDIDKFDISCSFAFSQVLDPNILAIAWNLDLDTTDANYAYQFAGSSPNTLAEAEWRMVGKGRSGLEIVFVMRKTIVIPNGDWTSGAPGSYTNVPITLRALQDTSVSDTKRDLAYFRIQKRALS